MAIPENKTQLIKAIKDDYGKLQLELSGIPLAAVSRKELEGHLKNTLMSIENLTAYLIGWGQLILKWNDGKSKGQNVDFPDTGYKWNQLGQLAQKFYTDYENEKYKNLLEILDTTVKKVLLLVDSKTNEELYEIDWYEKWSFGRMIQLNTSSPYKNATARIRRWKKTKQIN